MTDFKKLFYLDFKFRQYKASVFINGLIYFLGRLPIVGKNVPTVMLYREYELKKIFARIQLLFLYFFGFLRKFITLIICYFIVFLFHVNSFESVTPFFVWFILFNVIGTSSSLLFDGLNKEITFIKSFNLSRVIYIQNNFFLKTILNCLYLLPSLMWLGFLENNFVLCVLFGLSSFLLQSLFWGAINLRVTCLKKKWVVKSLIQGLYSLMVLCVSFLVIIKGDMSFFDRLFNNGFSWLICLALCLPVFYFYRQFNRFDAYARDVFSSSEALIQVGKQKNATQEKYLGEGKKMKLVKIGSEKELENKKGMTYLNALLFSRFKTSLLRQLQIRLAIISLVMLSFMIIVSQSPIPIKADEFETTVYNLIPSMFFVLYLASFGKKVTQTLFVNCDSAMLAYPFYREPKAIIRGFFYRFFKIFYYNGVIGGTIFIWVIIFNTCNHFILSYVFLGLLVFVMFALTILFSFHDLFIYYILQPFTSDLEVKNPIYKFVTGAFYFMAYMSLQLKTGGFIYAIIVSIISIVYFVIGSFIIVKYAPKTFKLKN